VPKQAQTLAKLLRHAGPLATLLFAADKLLHRWTRARILLVYLREPELLAGQDPMLPAGFTAQVRRPEAMGNLAAACAAELSAEFLTKARTNSDQCVAILEGDCVVSYQWLSDGLTWAYEDIWISFGPRYLYGYNSFTAPSHRGRHLNHSGVVIAAQALAVPNGKGLAGYIVASNVSSILAHSRVSSKYSGVVLVWPHGSGGLRILASPGCRGAGLQLVRRPSGLRASGGIGAVQGSTLRPL
jgi:hypothetical protein